MRDSVEATLAELVAPGPGATPRLVLVVDEMAERHLWWAVGRGLCAVLPRRTTSWDDVIAALVKAPAGDAELPSSTAGWLDQVRELDARLAAIGVNATGLTARETEILRLFAAGLETAEVARELNYVGPHHQVDRLRGQGTPRAPQPGPRSGSRLPHRGDLIGPNGRVGR